MCVIGQNVAGLLSKKDSLLSTINTLLPSVIICQETKMPKYGMLNLNGYQVFEKLRVEKSGGGLLVAVDKCISPVLLDSDDSFEIMTVEVSLSFGKLRIFNAYGPQENYQIDVKRQFWLALEKEINKAKIEGCMVLLQLDANAKVGQKIIPNAPNEEPSINGRFLIDMIQNQDLIMVNSSSLCKGSITRQRIFEDKVEKSIIDYMIICQRLEEFLIDLNIDEERIFSLYRCVKKKSTKKLVYSDHNMFIARFSIGISPLKSK